MTDTKTDEKATRPNELRRMADGMSEGYGLGDLELGWTDTISLLRGSADEIETLNALIGQLMQIAHCDALFNGGHGDRDPVVGFSLIMAEWNRICAENDNYETEIEHLRSELVTANHRVAGLTETWRRTERGAGKAAGTASSSQHHGRRPNERTTDTDT